MLKQLLFNKLSFLLLLISLGTTANAQKFGVQFDYFTVVEKPKGVIGFLGTGVHIHHPKLPLLGGIRINGALYGERAGYYTYGYYLGAYHNFNKKWSIHGQVHATSGGGAESNDGSGGMLGFYGHVARQIGPYQLGLGWGYTVVSRGIIQGNSAFVKLTRDIDFTQELERPAQINVFASTLLSNKNQHDRSTLFIGAGARIFKKFTFSSVILSATVSDLGGYMEVYGGYGVYKDLGPFRLMVEGNLGTGGGGKAPAGGGALGGYTAEAQVNLHNYTLGVNTGRMYSLTDDFWYGYTGVRLGRTLNFNSKHAKGKGKMSQLNIEHSFKSYFGEDGFVNIGTGFKFFDSEYFSLLGETYWAFTHGRGAYAEGLFGARVNYKIFFLEAQVGAGAGGGFNLWDAAALAFVNPGLEIPLKEGMYINARANRTVYSSQDFPKWGAQLGFVYQLPFVKY